MVSGCLLLKLRIWHVTFAELPLTNQLGQKQLAITSADQNCAQTTLSTLRLAQLLGCCDSGRAMGSYSLGRTMAWPPERLWGNVIDPSPVVRKIVQQERRVVRPGRQLTSNGRADK